MATKIGFKLQDKAIVPDTSALFDLSDTLLAQEEKREQQRQTWRDEQDALRKSQRDLTPTVNQNANQFFGKFSQGIMDVSTSLQNQLETGQISSSEYSAQWRNLNQSNEQMIAAQTSYQNTAQQIADDVASGKASEVNAKNLNHFNKVFQPGAMEVERDGRGGLKLFNKETGDVVSPSYLSDLTNSNLPKYDYTGVAKKLVDQFGKRGVIEGSGASITGVYANVADLSPEELNDLMQDEAEALLAGAQAPTVSILVDGMGYDVVYKEEDLKPGAVYRKPDGTFGFAAGDEEKAVKFMAEELRKALPREVKERQELTEQQIVQKDLATRRLELGYAQLGEKEEESRDIIGQIIQEADKDFANLLDDDFKGSKSNIESRFQEKLAPILSKYNVEIVQADPTDATEVELIIGDKRLNIDLYDNINFKFMSNDDLKKLIKDFVILNSPNESLIKTFKLLSTDTTQQPDPGGGAGKFNSNKQK